jgi:hypothetical protein
MVPVTVVFFYLKKIWLWFLGSHWPNDLVTVGCLDENFTITLAMWMKSGHLNYQNRW